MTAVLETSGLTKRYRRVTALSDCTISVPEGRMSALVGPNGAGKTTQLRLLAGLAAPTAGQAIVLGGTPRQDPAYLAGIGFLAQEAPLYRRRTAEDHIGMGAHMNPRWDSESARARLGGLNIPLDRPVGTLSGGQRAQVALALTLQVAVGLQHRIGVNHCHRNHLPHARELVAHAQHPHPQRLPHLLCDLLVGRHSGPPVHPEPDHVGAPLS